MKQRAFALVLALCMVLSVLPGFTFPAAVQALPEPVIAPAALPELPAQPMAETYSVTMTSTGPGVAELYAASAGAQESVYFLADPEPGYRVSFDKCGYYKEQYDMRLIYLGSNVYEIIMPDGDVILDLEFVAIESDSHDVTVTVSEGGMASVDQTAAKNGESLFVEVIPTPGYSLESVKARSGGEWMEGYYLGKVDGAELYEVFMPDAELEILVTFKRNGPYTITTYITGNGTVELSGEEVVSNAAQLGSNATYSGAAVELSDCLYTFTSQEDGTWVVTSIDADGNTVYLNPGINGIGYPNTVSSDGLVSIFNGYLEDTFSIYGGKDSDTMFNYYLCFDRSDLCWSRVTDYPDTTGNINRSLMLYRSVEGDGSNEIPGYERVTELEDITNGQYLVVGSGNDGNLYTLYPNTATDNRYCQAAKILGHATSYELDTITITATPDRGHQVVSVGCYHSAVTKVGENTWTFPMPKFREEVHVSFAPIVYPVSVALELEMGGTAILDKETAIIGETVTLTCVPDEGYRVARVTGAELVDNGDNTYSFVMDNAPVELSVLFLRENNPFLDVNETHFYHDPVLWAVENGITNGVDAEHFGPMGVCNRAQVVTFLWRAAGSPAPTATENPFEDVAEGTWYTDAVLWAVESGITNGVDATHFGPNTVCNRAQVVTFLYRANGSPKIGAEENPFTDVEEDSFYRDAVLWALENGVTTGASETTFNPGGQCLRAQVVTFLYRADQIPEPEPDPLPFPSVG